MTTTIAIERKNLSYTYDANGYMLSYKGKPLGGAGVKLPRDKPLHWRHAQANRHDNQQSAEREIAALLAGNGQGRFLELIAKIDAEQEFKTEAEVCCHRVAIRYWGFDAKLTKDLKRDLAREGRQRARYCIANGYQSGDLNCLYGNEEIRGWWEIIT